VIFVVKRPELKLYSQKNHFMRFTISLLFLLVLLEGCLNVNDKEKGKRYSDHNEAANITSLDPALRVIRLIFGPSTRISNGLVQLSDQTGDTAMYAKSMEIQKRGGPILFT